MFETVISVVLGAILSILITIWVENLRRPRLKISIEPPVNTALVPVLGGAPAPFTSLRVRVLNKSLSWLAGWIERAAAEQCRGEITFHRFADGQNIFGRAMAARWAGGPQPSPIPIVNVATQQVEHLMLDDQRLGAAGSAIDIYPGDSEPLDVVCRFDTDQQCYGWNNETYFLQPPAQLGRNPNWELGHERYLVKIIVRSSGHTRVAVFQLINDVPTNAFRLQQATSAERSRVK
jgi:hypothetical protein